MNLRDSFADSGSIAPNPRWAWSAVNPITGVPAVALWHHGMVCEGSTIIYDDRLGFDGANKLGNRARLKHLKYAFENGIPINVVQIFAKDSSAPEPVIASGRCYPMSQTAKITHLDLKTGAFRAELILNQRVQEFAAAWQNRQQPEAAAQ